MQRTFINFILLISCFVYPLFAQMSSSAKEQVAKAIQSHIANFNQALKNRDANAHNKCWIDEMQSLVFTENEISHRKLINDEFISNSLPNYEIFEFAIDELENTVELYSNANEEVFAILKVVLISKVKGETEEERIQQWATLKLNCSKSKTEQVNESYPSMWFFKPFVNSKEEAKKNLNYLEKWEEVRLDGFQEYFYFNPNGGGYKDRSGKLIFSTQSKYENIGIYYLVKIVPNNMFYCYYENNDKKYYAIMDNKGKRITDFKYDYIDINSSKGERIVAHKDKKQILIDEKGTELVSFDIILKCVLNDYFTFKHKGKWGLINLDGNIVIEPK